MLNPKGLHPKEQKSSDITRIILSPLNPKPLNPKPALRGFHIRAPERLRCSRAAPWLGGAWVLLGFFLEV